MGSPDIHFNSLVLDAHQDIYELNDRIKAGEEFPLRDTILPRLNKAGIDIVFWTIGGDSWLHSSYTNLRLKGALANWARFERQIAACSGDVIRVESAAQFSPTPDGKLRILYALEGGMPLHGDLDILDAFYGLGVRVLQLVWNYRNELGDGTLEAGFAGGGLSQFGKEVVERMNELGMVVDLAHMTEPGAFDALGISKDPVIVSHGNAQTICPHPHNLSDELIDAIAEADGCIGVHSLPTKVASAEPTLNNLVDHIEYIANRVGIDHVGLGLNKTEFTGIVPPQDKRPSPKENEPKTLKGLASLEDLPNLTQAMLDRDFAETDVRKVLADNFLRVFKQVAG